jgi:hypothetical protein
VLTARRRYKSFGVKGLSWLRYCDTVLLNCCDERNGEACGSLASCVQEDMRSVARLRNTEGLSGVPPSGRRSSAYPALLPYLEACFPVASVGALLQRVDYIDHVCLLFLI